MWLFEPQIKSGVPNEWFAKESITLSEPDGRANVIASSEPLDPSITTKEYAERQGSLLSAEMPGYRELVFDTQEVFGGREGFIRQFQWVPPDGEAVTQIQLYLVENTRGYTATATASLSTFSHMEAELIAILRSIVIG